MICSDEAYVEIDESLCYQHIDWQQIWYQAIGSFLKIIQTLITNARTDILQMWMVSCFNAKMYFLKIKVLNPMNEFD